jgi:putative transcriptional regulator
MPLTSPRAGLLLVATPLLNDPNFSRSVVLLLSHDGDGTLGVILDRPTTIEVGEYLPAWEPVATAPPVVFAGGPVEPDIGIGVCLRFGSIELVDLGHDPVDDSPVRVFAGCAGWGPGQLESELDEGAWFVVDFDHGDLLDPEPDNLWSAVLRRQNSRLALFSSFPSDPAMN